MVASNSRDSPAVVSQVLGLNIYVSTLSSLKRFLFIRLYISAECVLGGGGWTHSLGDQERCLDSSSIALYLSLWKDVSLNLESIVIWLGWLGSKFQQPTCSPKCWDCGQVPRHLDFYVGAGECFHACRVGAHYTHTATSLVSKQVSY